MMATKDGLIKKTRLSEFESIRKGGKIAIKLNDDDVLISVRLTKEKDEVLVASSEGKCIRFCEDTVRVLGRDTMGVKAMKLAENERIVSMIVIKPDADMLTVSENGYGKRTSESEYRLQGRNGKGIKAGIFNEVTGGLVNLKQVSDDDDVMLIADDGVIIRVSAEEISKIGRNTKGVKIMKIKEKSRIVCVAVTKSDKSEEKLAEELEELPEEPVMVEGEVSSTEMPLEMEETAVVESVQEDGDNLL